MQIQSLPARQAGSELRRLCRVDQAVWQRACLLGRDVLFVSAQKLFSCLGSSRAGDSYNRALARFARPDLLILDDLGLRNTSGSRT